METSSFHICFWEMISNGRLPKSKQKQQLNKTTTTKTQTVYWFSILLHFTFLISDTGLPARSTVFTHDNFQRISCRKVKSSHLLKMDEWKASSEINQTQEDSMLSLLCESWKKKINDLNAETVITREGVVGDRVWIRRLIAEQYM